MRVLTVNAGSSSLKLRLLDQDEPIAGQEWQRWTGEEVSIRDFLDQYEVDAVGHRIVHGGTKIVEPTVVDDEVRRYLAFLTDVAPLHQSRALDGIQGASETAPKTPAVVCVDTAFHTTIPEAAATYALPRE